MIRTKDYPGFRLPGNETSKIPRYWVFYDTETKTDEKEGETVQQFYMGWTCFVEVDAHSKQWKETWQFWTNEKKMNVYLHEQAIQYKNLFLLGHNVFFDMQASGFFGYFTDWNWQLKFIYDQGLTYILRAVNGEAVITALSTTNWFDQSLEKLGETLGIEKLEVDFEKSEYKDIKTYCRRDVEILVYAMKYYINFINYHDLGNFALTKASQAFNAFRHRFKKHKIVIHRNQQAKDLERLAYMGGRCEAFRIGEMEGGPFITLDINSMYPYVMRENKYPTELIRYGENESIRKMKSTILKHGVVAEVVVNTDEPVYAVKSNGKTIFPTGCFTCYVTTHGMKYAIEQGHVQKINRAAIYKMAPLFPGYVDYFYHLKLKYQAEGNKMMTLFTKYMLNSLYGKFGQKKPVLEEFETDTGKQYSREEALNIDTGEVYIITQLMNKMVVQKGEKEGKLSFPGLAAHVTEHGRILLWQIIKSVGRENVLYCDTDSIKIKEKDFDKVNWLISNVELGALKEEDRTERLYIGGAKYYITDSQRNIKGIPKKAVETGPGEYTFDVFYRQNTHLRKSHDSGVITGKMTRIVTHQYDKGVVGPNGYVEPFHFEFPG